MDTPTNLEVMQGATFLLPCQYTDGTNPIDITGYSGRGAIYTSAREETPLATFTVTVTAPLLGEFEVMLPASQSKGLVLSGAGYDKPSEFYYLVELYTAGDADVKWMLFGRIKVYPGKAE